MAIFHLSASIISRKAGRSSTAAAAYRSAEKIVDERTGEVHDYERKRGVEYTEIIVPAGMDTPERKVLWNAVECKNKRADAQVAREITLALPCELTPEQRKELAQEFTHSLADKYSLAVDLAIHAPGREGDNRNHHAHILMTTNRFEGVQNGEIVLGNKVRELDMIASAKSEQGKANAIENIREEWAHSCNMALEKAGELARVDNRSLSAQGIDRAPTIHQGPAATEIERRGEESRLVEINANIAEYNKQIETISAAQREIAEINRLLSEIQDRTPEEKAQTQPVENEPIAPQKIPISTEEARRLFNERMEKERPGWQEEYKRIQEAKRETGHTGEKSSYFVGSMKEQFSNLDRLRHDALSAREKMEKATAARKAAGAFAFGEKKRLDAEIAQYSDKFTELATRHDNIQRKIGHLREPWELCQKHDNAFQSSKELKAYQNKRREQLMNDMADQKQTRQRQKGRSGR